MNDVWILHITHRHGEEISVYTSRESAFDAVVEYVYDWWDQELTSYDGVKTERPEDDEAMVDCYFGSGSPTTSCAGRYLTTPNQVTSVIGRSTAMGERN